MKHRAQKVSNRIRFGKSNLSLGMSMEDEAKEFEELQAEAERNFICTRDHTYYDPKTKKYIPR